MAEELLKSIKQLSKERGISPDIFYSAIEEALLTVANKYFHNEADIHVEIDKDRGKIEVYCTKLVVHDIEDPIAEIDWKEALKYDSKAKLGDEIKIFLPGETLGRVAAQTAKQIIMFLKMGTGISPLESFLMPSPAAKAIIRIYSTQRCFPRVLIIPLTAAGTSAGKTTTFEF